SQPVSLLPTLCHHLSTLYSFFYSSGVHRDLHSFPTRRSSDLFANLWMNAPGWWRKRSGGRRRVKSPHVRLPNHRHINRPSSVHQDRKSTRLNSSHVKISYAVFCLKKKKKRKRE